MVLFQKQEWVNLNNERLQKYANLLVRAGGNVQKGSPVVISSAVDDAYFARMVQDAAYDAGASDVTIDWTDDASVRAKFLRASSEVFDEFPEWRVAKLKYQDDKGSVYLRIESSDPDNLKGVESDRLQRFTKVASQATRPHAELMMSNALRWSIIALPSPAWARKVFPTITEAEAIDKLWTCILKAARADGDDPVAEWQKHRENFTKRVEYLNAQQFDSLHITTGLGTDFTVGLVQNHNWEGGGDIDKTGIPFFPNMPTEEVFTMPHRDRANGRVVASMPLTYQGNLIENFEMTFKNGIVIDYKAETNQDILKNLMETDEGARRLGEVALVANSSPIGQMGVLFYNTLFDENASAHLALGKAYPTNMQGAESLTTEQRTARGCNDSLIHEDFMFGTADMNITGIKPDGTEVNFFKNGEFDI
ncbi:MAG: aminopeptidase [Defluviitaleaceae bacterium]|nr:aminopeptidase [Defluviitaleaceae bacterium]